MKAFAATDCHGLRCSVMKKTALWYSLLLLLAAPLLFAQSGTPPGTASAPLAPTLGVKSAAEIDREWQLSVSKYDTERNRLLAENEKQANDGPYRADWATLMKYEQPQWYKDAK